MRTPHREQLYFGSTPVTKVELNPNCRDRMIPVAPQLAGILGLLGWRQSKSLWKKAKKAGRAIGRINKNGANYKDRLQERYEKLFQITDLVLPRTQELLDARIS